MRFSCVCDREVINANDCSCLGNVRDIELDTDCGKIVELVIPGPGKYMGIFGRDSEFCIPWEKVIRIGPDIILVDFDEKEMRKKI